MQSIYVFLKNMAARDLFYRKYNKRAFSIAQKMQKNNHIRYNLCLMDSFLIFFTHKYKDKLVILKNDTLFKS